MLTRVLIRGPPAVTKLSKEGGVGGLTERGKKSSLTRLDVPPFLLL